MLYGEGLIPAALCLLADGNRSILSRPTWSPLLFEYSLRIHQPLIRFSLFLLPRPCIVKRYVLRKFVISAIISHLRIQIYCYLCMPHLCS